MRRTCGCGGQRPEDLKFHLHVSKAVSKASRMLGLVHVTFSCLDESTVPRLFTTIGRPHLEYGNIIWHPRYRRDKLEVEKIQRRATRLIPSLKGLSYEERLRALKLPSLEHRRRRGDPERHRQVRSRPVLHHVCRVDYQRPWPEDDEDIFPTGSKTKCVQPKSSQRLETRSQLK